MTNKSKVKKKNPKYPFQKHEAVVAPTVEVVTYEVLLLMEKERTESSPWRVWVDKSRIDKFVEIYGETLRDIQKEQNKLVEKYVVFVDGKPDYTYEEDGTTIKSAKFKPEFTEEQYLEEFNKLMKTEVPFFM